MWLLPVFSALSRSALRLFYRLTLAGERVPPEGPVLLVANHISWLDILVMHAARHCRFVAKAEVRHWPLLRRLVDFDLGLIGVVDAGLRMKRGARRLERQQPVRCGALRPLHCDHSADLGLIDRPIAFIAQPNTSLWSIAAVDIWKISSRFTMLTTTESSIDTPLNIR